jgi:hypothetical protein
LIIWAPMAAAAWLLRYPMRHIAAIVASGGIFVTLYMYRFLETGPAGSSFDPARFREYHVFFTTMLNKIVEPPQHQLGVVLTLLSVAFVGTISILVGLPKWRKPEFLWPVATLWFIGGTIALTAIGRANSGFVGRYYTPAIAWWSFVLVAALLFVDARWRTMLAFVFALLCGTLLITDQAQIGKIRSTQTGMNLGTASIAVGVDDQVNVFNLGAFGFIVPENLRFLVASRKVWTTTEPFSEIGKTAGTLPRCGGETTIRVAKISASHAAGFQITASSKTPAKKVLLIVEGMVAGVGIQNADASRWTGYLPLAAAGKQVTAQIDGCESGSATLPIHPEQLPVQGPSADGALHWPLQWPPEWQLQWQAGQPVSEAVGVEDRVVDGMLEFRNQLRFGFHTIRLQKPLRDYETIIVRMKCDKDDFAMLIHLPGGEIRGHLISGGGEWRLAKFHIGRVARRQQFTSPLLHLTVGPIYGERMAISHVWGSNQPIPDRDLDVQFYREK